MKCCSILLNKAQKQNPKGSSNLLNVDKCVSITTVKTMIITITPKSLLMPLSQPLHSYPLCTPLLSTVPRQIMTWFLLITD